MFINEHRNHWYSSGSYYWSKNLYLFIRFFIIDYIYLFIAYYGVTEPDVVDWYQGFWQIPDRFLLLIIYVFIGNANLHGKTSIIYGDSWK